MLTRHRGKLLTVAGLAAIIFGLGALVVGGFAWSYTTSTATEQMITVSEDADFPFADKGGMLNGPFDMLGQASAIEHHQLERTGGQYYAQMSRRFRCSMMPAMPCSTRTAIR